MKSVISKRPWLRLPIYVPAREFAGSALLAFEAASRGWGCLIGNKYFPSPSPLPTGLTFVKKFAPDMTEKIAAIRGTGERVVGWCEEGLVYPNAAEYGRRKIAPTAYDQVERFYCWGQNQADDLAGPLGLRAEKMAVTGNPRLDLHRPELRDFFEPQVCEIRNEYAPFILINTRFSVLNSFSGAAAEAQKWADRRKTADRQDAYDLVAFQKKLYDSFVDLIRALSQRAPHYNIVIRPHPSESPRPWQLLAAELPRVSAVLRGNVIPWIIASDAVIHTNCTTAVEAYLLGRTPIAYRPYSDVRFDMPLPNALSVHADDVDDVLHTLNHVGHTEHSSPEVTMARATTAARYITAIHGPLASARIMDILDTLDAPRHPLRVKDGPFVRAGAKISQAHHFLRLQLDPTYKQRFSPKKMGRTTDESELKHFLTRLQAVNDRFDGIRVSSISPGVHVVWRPD